MTQFQFAQATGLSLASIQAFEGGKRPSDATQERLKTFAVEHGQADLVAEFFPVAVTRVLEPAPKGRRRRAASADQSADLHALLDEILASNHADLKLAVDTLLNTCIQSIRRVR